uniref:Uncharacterized protein n=1 Tax=Dromaius novaehollandiae TaxID=8790 RepID=A0A8C4KSE6_DRONO
PLDVEDRTPCVFGVKANEHQIEQALKKLHDINVATLDVLIRPNSKMEVVQCFCVCLSVFPD